MNQVNDFDELGLGTNKRSLLYSKQKNFKKTTQLSHSPTPRTGKSMAHSKFQTLKTQKNSELKFDEYEKFEALPGKLETEQLAHQIEKLNVSLRSQTKVIEKLKSHNQDLVSILLNILDTFINTSKLASFFTNKIVLEIKTTLVGKLEEFSFLGLDYKNEIEQVSLWGKNYNIDKKTEKTVNKVGESELHPLNPMRKVHFPSEEMVAVFRFQGEMVRDI